MVQLCQWTQRERDGFLYFFILLLLRIRNRGVVSFRRAVFIEISVNILLGVELQFFFKIRDGVWGLVLLGLVCILGGFRRFLGGLRFVRRLTFRSMFSGQYFWFSVVFGIVYGRFQLILRVFGRFLQRFYSSLTVMAWLLV